jgi:hypothetical protein
VWKQTRHGMSSTKHVPQGSLEISVFRPRTDVPWIPPRRLVSLIAALVSFLLHALLLTGAMWGGHARKGPPPQPQSLAASTAQSKDDPAMQLIVLDAGTNADSAGGGATPASPIPAPTLMPIAVTTPLPQFAADFPDDIGSNSPNSTDSATDDIARSELYGRYMGQIDARIQRAWQRPRTPVGAPMFSCRVRIEQDTTGAVREVTLQRCNGDDRWQLSLVHAIESASPLPAPPDPGVFNRVIHLSFQAEPYSPSAATELYEPERIANLSAESDEARNNQEALRALDQALRDPHAHPGVIDLRIEGHANPINP